ncbi:hypothetical protein LguiA_012344 [Lonicera macranthoides]
MSKDQLLNQSSKQLGEIEDDDHKTQHGEPNHDQLELINDYEECRTPTSDDHKIPAVEICPGAPRKEREVLPRLHKRKVSPTDELEFFEIKGHDELESFFRSCFEDSRVCSTPKKRRL